jgi:hypothetical protein
MGPLLGRGVPSLPGPRVDPPALGSDGQPARLPMHPGHYVACGTTAMVRVELARPLVRSHHTRQTRCHSLTTLDETDAVTSNEVCKSNSYLSFWFCFFSRVFLQLLPLFRFCIFVLMTLQILTRDRKTASPLKPPPPPPFFLFCLKIRSASCIAGSKSHIYHDELRRICEPRCGRRWRECYACAGCPAAAVRLGWGRDTHSG